MKINVSQTQINFFVLKEAPADLCIPGMTRIKWIQQVSKYGVISGPYSVQMRENVDQKLLLIWTLFMPCESSYFCIYNWSKWYQKYRVFK